MALRSAVFKYKTIKGPLHKWPALLKLALLLPLSLFCISLPSNLLVIGILAAVISAFLCKFTLREQLTDLKPALYYAGLMYVLSFFSNITENKESISSLVTNFSLLIVPNPYFLRTALRLVFIIQLSALLFRTTSSIELRESLCKINKKLGAHISLFLGFIPQIFENWSTINMAYKARGGKNGLKKIRVTVFILISLSMEKAAQKAKALEGRKSYGIN